MVKYYDCEKTRDFIHEWARYRLAASKSPGMEIVEPWDPDAIERIQKWSDEHPEAPKLTKAERAFLEAWDLKRTHVRITRSRVRDKYELCICFRGEKDYADVARITIRPDMFGFIEPGGSWDLGRLLCLEVEE